MRDSFYYSFMHYRITRTDLLTYRRYHVRSMHKNSQENIPKLLLPELLFWLVYAPNRLSIKALPLTPPGA